MPKVSLKAKTIWKYELAGDTQELDIPEGGEVLTIQIQNGAICIWVLVDPNRPKEKRSFEVVGTGEPILGNPGKYLGTIQERIYVWHIFETSEVGR